jgi:hypothetical protein
MRLVRMQYVALSRQGISTHPAIAERLYASERKTDRIRVVSVRTERLPFQGRFQPLYAFASPAGNQSIDHVVQAGQVAQPFKIAGRIFGHDGPCVAPGNPPIPGKPAFARESRRGRTRRSRKPQHDIPRL